MMTNKDLILKQTKLESLLETLTNIFFAFWISFAYWKYVIIPMITSGTIQLDDTLYITTAFTILAIVRQYFFRRFFNAGIHTAIGKWVKKYYAK